MNKTQRDTVTKANPLLVRVLEQVDRFESLKVSGAMDDDAVIVVTSGSCPEPQLTGRILQAAGMMGVSVEVVADEPLGICITGTSRAEAEDFKAPEVEESGGFFDADPAHPGN